MGFIARLFGRSGASTQAADPRLGAMVDRVVAMSPRLRLAPRWQERLSSAIGQGLADVRGLVSSFAQPRELSPAAWASDCCIRAWFGAAGDVSHTIARSVQLRELFDTQAAASEGYAVLGMTCSERRTLGVAQAGNSTRSDVEQTTVSFGDHRLRVCAPDMAALMQELVARLVDQLMLEALAKIAADSTRRDDLVQERALLATRLRLLEREDVGMRSIIGSDDATPKVNASTLKERLEENDRELAALGTRSEALDRQLETVCQVFSDAASLLTVKPRRLRLSRMNVLVSEDEDGEVVEFDIARVPGDPPQERAFALVRVARSDLGQAIDPLNEAARLLV